MKHMNEVVIGGVVAVQVIAVFLYTRFSRGTTSEDAVEGTVDGVGETVDEDTVENVTETIEEATDGDGELPHPDRVEEIGDDLKQITGISTWREQRLIENGYETAYDIHQASDDELTDVVGIGTVVARQIREDLTGNPDQNDSE